MEKQGKSGALHVIHDAQIHRQKSGVQLVGRSPEFCL
jgi:hypothetical protein